MRILALILILACLDMRAKASAAVLSPEIQLRLEEARERWRSYGHLCQGTFPSKVRDDSTCDDGDSVLFNGILCLSGEELGCQGVRSALDDQGQWWRSPRRVGGSLESENSFSRDMAAGVLAYLLGTGDQGRAELWMNWLETHGKSEKIKGIKTPTLTQFCTNGKDATCVATPGFWGVASNLWEFFGWPQRSRMQDPYKDFRALGSLAKVVVKALFGGLDGFSEFEVKKAPLGYQLHLKGVQIWLYQKMGRPLIDGFVDVEHSAELIYQRDPANPFFAFLHQGVSDELAVRLLTLCPAEGQDAPRYQWSWERESKEEAWHESMGWDCVFLANLLLTASAKS